MKITKIHIEKFRGFHGEDCELGSMLTAIAGQNGTQKSTLLGMITQPFTISSKDNPMVGEKPLSGGNYKSAFSDKFRLSPQFDKPKEHEWILFFDDGTPNFTVESILRDKSEKVRFWKKGARKQGSGYIQFPTIFLSLKRLIPVAEDTGVVPNKFSLTDKEQEEFKELHNKILISQTPVSSTTTITSKNKQSIGVSTDLYDWNQNSMGQDNLGKIILAIFSFKRLKENYPDSYRGGILAIDELDATMYPASQVELLKVLRKYASKLNLQILFTTHSISLLSAVDGLVKEVSKKKETANQVKILYLRKVDNNIRIEQGVGIERILLDLNVIAKGNQQKKKITVYTEDKETQIFAKSILKSRARILDFVDVSFPCTALIDLAHRKVPVFSVPLAMIILDGDAKEGDGNEKKIKKAGNILTLPGSKSPERMLAEHLYNLSDEDPLWEQVSEGYSKQVCFREFSLKDIKSTGENGRQTAKTWFSSQLEENWKRKKSLVFNSFLTSIRNDAGKFVEEFDRMIEKFRRCGLFG